MTLFEVLSDFIKGAKIKRLSWHQNIWLETTDSTDGQLARLLIKEDEGVRLINSDEIFKLCDVRATDWTIIK